VAYFAQILAAAAGLFRIPGDFLELMKSCVYQEQMGPLGFDFSVCDYLRTQTRYSTG
jgi:hypothetical protein